MGHLIRQRAASAGITGLLSAPISLERHQIEVIRQVLQDPVQRYLLADEVGLGKTIEAGVIIRQHVLDHPLTHRVLVIVPEGLADQWDAELNMRCQVGAEFGHCITIVTFEMLTEWDDEQPDLLVVDEAHQGVRGWSDDKSSKFRMRFERLRQLSAPALCPKLLLLSATPIRRNEKGFLALLHLLDPAVYPLDDVAAFEARVAKRQEVADLFAAFTEDQQVFFLESMVDRLAQLFPNDHRLSKLLDRVRPHLAFDAQVGEAELRADIRAVRLHLSETYRLHRRLLRNRRTEEGEGLLPGRAGLTLFSWNDGTMPRIEGMLDAWRSRAAAAIWGQEESPWAKHLAQLFSTLLEAAWGDAGALMACVEARLTGRAPKHLMDFGSLTEAARMDLLTHVPKFSLRTKRWTVSRNIPLTP